MGKIELLRPPVHVLALSIVNVPNLSEIADPGNLGAIGVDFAFSSLEIAKLAIVADRETLTAIFCSKGRLET
jgi:hypothetical protein